MHLDRSLITPILVLCLLPLSGSTGCASGRAGTDSISSSIGGEVTHLPAKARPAPSDDRPITIAAVGDIMMGSTFPEGAPLPPKDGAGLLEEVSPILSAADIAFGNLEGPMIDGGTSVKCPPPKPETPPTTPQTVDPNAQQPAPAPAAPAAPVRKNVCFAFRVPTRYGTYLKDAGFDVMSLANNHAFDFGTEGRETSMRVLDQLGIKHTGKVGDIAHLEANGKSVAVIAFATYKHSYNFLDLENTTQLVRTLKAKNDIVVVSFHGGAEGSASQNVPYGPEKYLNEDRGDLRKFTHAVVDAGADLVIGHGPHVLRGMEVYKDRLIAYSLGNFATYGMFNLSGPLGLTMVLEARIAADGRFISGRIHPAKQIKPGGPKLDESRAAIGVVKRLSAADFGPSAVKVKDDGTITPQ